MSAEQVLGFRCGSEGMGFYMMGTWAAFCSLMGGAWSFFGQRMKSPKVRLFPLGDSGLADTK